MHIAVVSVFPQMFDALTEHGVVGRALGRGLLSLSRVDPRDFTRDRHRTVDDRPYGGGPGMVMLYEPLKAAIEAAAATVPDRAGASAAATAPAGTVARPRRIYLSPQGRRLDQAMLAELAAEPALVLVCGRYEGIDERLIEAEIDDEISIGDYVLSGGELAAMVVVDGLARLLPGVLGHPDSAAEDSFTDGLLDCPHYSRPEVVDGRRVPAVLLGGDHGAIRRWRHAQALGRTAQRRPDLIDALRDSGTPPAEIDGLLAAYREALGEDRRDGAGPAAGAADRAMPPAVNRAAGPRRPRPPGDGDEEPDRSGGGA